MKGIYTFLIFFAAFILQTTVFNALSIFGVTPNIILCLIIVFGFLYDSTQTFIWATVFGLVLDLHFSQVIGISALCYFLIALAVYVVKDFINRENMVSIIGLIIGATFLYDVMYWGISKIFAANYDFVSMLKMQPPLILYNTIVVIILYKLLIRKIIRYRSDKKFKGRFISYE